MPERPHPAREERPQGSKDELGNRLPDSLTGAVMKVFLSWSGRTSREVAQAFHDWLPFVIQAVRPFISTGDIDKGKRWNDALSTELAETAYGILIITPDNYDKPWL